MASIEMVSVMFLISILLGLDELGFARNFAETQSNERGGPADGRNDEHDAATPDFQPRLFAFPRFWLNFGRVQVFRFHDELWACVLCPWFGRE